MVHKQLCAYMDEFTEGRRIPLEERMYRVPPSLGRLQYISFVWL